jgi:YD repeat-containing protein
VGPTKFTYDARHLLQTKTTKRGFAYTYAYDFAGRHMLSTWPDTSTREVEPIAVVGLVDPAAPTPPDAIRTADVEASFTDGNGNVTRFRLNVFGASTEVTDALNRTRTFQRDQDNNATLVTDPNNVDTEAGYDERGNLTTITHAKGDPQLERTTTIEFEPVFNQVTKFIDPEQNETLQFFDANGNLERIVDGDVPIFVEKGEAGIVGS